MDNISLGSWNKIKTMYKTKTMYKMISIEAKTISITTVSLGERGQVQIGTIWKLNGLDHYYHDPFIKFLRRTSSQWWIQVNTVSEGFDCWTNPFNHVCMFYSRLQFLVKEHVNVIQDSVSVKDMLWEYHLYLRTD